MENLVKTGRKVEILSWRSWLFSVYVVGCELVVRWRNIGSVLSVNGQENVDGGNNNNTSGSDDDDDGLVEEEEDLMLVDKEKISRRCTSERSRTNRASLNVDRWKYCQIVGAGFTFDEEIIGRVPVLLLQVGDRREHGPGFAVEYIFVKVSPTQTDLSSSCSVNHNCDQTSRLTAKNRRPSPEFVIEITRSYSLNISYDVSTSSQNHHPVFLTSLQLLFINPNPNTLSLQLYTRDTFSSHNRIQDFDLTVSNKNLSDIQILDCVYIQEDRSLIAIIYFKTEEGQAKCQCFKLSLNVSFDSDSVSEKYDVSQLPMDILFESDFAEIVKEVNILSLISNFNLISRSQSFCSSVIMITQTGYALRFIDGAMSCCVNLVGNDDDTGEQGEVNWSSAVVKIISFEGCPDRTAVQINTSCCLIDWTREKVIRSWHSVSSAVPCDIRSCGVSSLLLVFEAESEHFVDAQKPCLLLEEAKIRVIDVDCELQSDDDEEGNNHGAAMSSSDKVRHADTVHVNEDFENQPQCAVHALLGQQKKCEDAVTELDSELRSKLSFLTETWQQLSDVHISDVNESVSLRASPDKPPLAVVIEGSLPRCHYQHSTRGHDLRQTAKKHTEFGLFWKRIVDSQLVVGVSVRNVSERALTDMFLNIVPTSGGQEHIFQSTSKCAVILSIQSEGARSLAEPGNSLHRQTGIARMDFGQCSYFKQACLLPCGHSVVATCTADLSQAICSTDLRFSVFLSYSVLTGDKHLPEVPKNDAVLERNVQEFCCELIMTSCDLLNETYSLGIGTDGSVSDLTNEDLWALDCLQENLILTVQSVVSSVTCLSLKLTSHPSIRYLEWAEQFIFVATHWLKHCRVQILEQYSRHGAKLKVFSMSHSQVLLLVNFLYSILPEDITITPNQPASLSAIMHTGQTILQDIDSNINAIKQQIDNFTNVMPPGEEKLPQEESLSPKFHTKKSVKIKQEMYKQTSLGDSTSCKSTESEGERKLFRRAKKRFREIWGDADSPESG